MPYTKTLTKGKKEIYRIKSIQISLVEKQVNGEIDHIDYDESQNPQVTKIYFGIINQNNQIIDPAWNDQSTPPKPTGFTENNPDTWGSLTVDQIPRVTDPTKQYFDLLIVKTGATGATVYDKMKNVIYETLIELETLPGGTAWTIE